MDNAHLPAMPQTNRENLCMQTGTPKFEHMGLTKREMFAMNAPSCPDWYDTNADVITRFFNWPWFYADSMLSRGQ